MDSTGANEHTPSRGVTATGDESTAKFSRNLNTETVTDVGVCPFIHLHDTAGDVIEAHEHRGDFKEW